MDYLQEQDTEVTLKNVIKVVLDSLEKNKNVILFIDEIHMIMGVRSAGGSSVDIANLMKPY